MTLKHLDLFSGIGGFALAAQWAGFQTIGFAEIDPFCQRVLSKHWPHIRQYGSVNNIHNLNFGKTIDLITGGFPCQPFSMAGKQQGRNDDRYLWPAFRRIINTNQPHWVVAENVPGIIKLELDEILDDLENEGYETQTFIIPACAVGAPHRRERVWIVAHALSERCDYGANLTVWKQIQTHWERDIAALQSEWTGFFPYTWKTFNFKNWFGLTTNTDSEQCYTQSENTQTFSKRSERSKSFGEIRTSFDAFGLITNASNLSSQQTDSRLPTIETAWNEYGRKDCESNAQHDWKENQPPIPGMDDGLPFGMDRNKSLGNAIVPQVIYPILRLIALIERMQNESY